MPNWEAISVMLGSEYIATMLLVSTVPSQIMQPINSNG